MPAVLNGKGTCFARLQVPRVHALRMYILYAKLYLRTERQVLLSTESEERGKKVRLGECDCRPGPARREPVVDPRTGQAAGPFDGPSKHRLTFRTGHGVNTDSLHGARQVGSPRQPGTLESTRRT